MNRMNADELAEVRRFPIDSMVVAQLLAIGWETHAADLDF